MLRFASKPDAVFSELVKRVLEEVIGQLEDDLEFNYNDGGGWVSIYFEKETIKAFGGDKEGIALIKKELEKLLAAHGSKDVYMPSDYHFKLLDRIITFWSDVYSDSAAEWDSDPKSKECVLRYRGKPIYEIDKNAILETFFWDTDYDFNPELAKSLSANRILKDRVADVSNSAINASLNREPDTEDLKLVKWDGDLKDWGKPGTWWKQ